MKTSIENKKVIISELPDRITSDNVEEFANELETLIQEETHEALDIDFSKVTYIASAGLRVILRLTKKEKKFRIIEVSRDVYEIFEMVGFAQMMAVVKKRRRISLEGAELIGEGYFSKVYRLDAETIVKMYIRDTSIEDIERELGLAKQAFVLGVPTAISYDVVEIEDKFGVVFELLNCGTLRDALKNEPEKFEQYIDQYIKLLMIINTTETTDITIPDAKKVALHKLDVVKDKIEKEDYEKLQSLLLTVPEANTFVHGDCHIKNVMLSGEELLLIDMDTLSKGNPIFELALLYCTYNAFEVIYKGNNEAFLGITHEMTHRIFTKIMEQYCEASGDELVREKCKIETVAYAHMMFWLHTNTPDDTASFEKAYELTKEYMKQVTDLQLKLAENI